jgi:hypothetical protein
MLASSSVLERVIQAQQGGLSFEVAKFILSLSFPVSDVKRSRELSEKAQMGSLTEAEKAELDDLLTTNDVLMILKSSARLRLKHTPPSAA